MRLVVKNMATAYSYDSWDTATSIMQTSMWRNLTSEIKWNDEDLGWNGKVALNLLIWNQVQRTWIELECDLDKRKDRIKLLLDVASFPGSLLRNVTLKLCGQGEPILT